jgi:hypothetical protein
MNTRILTIVAGALLVGCGEKAQEMKNAANLAEQLAAAGGKIEQTQNEAETFYKARQEKGDTVAMPYAELQKLLPSAPSGYSATEEPGGSSQSMAGFSMSQAEQTFAKPADADGNAPKIQVTIIDFGGTQAAYGMMALPMMMNLSQEDAHHRMQTLKMDMPHTWASEEYNKDSKDAKVTAVTRYRYVITVEARNQAEDQSAMLKSLAEDIARKFEGK